MESPEAPKRVGEAGWTGLAPPRTVERKRKGRGVDVISGLPTPPSTVRRGIPTPPSTKRARKTSRADLDLTISAIGLPTPQTLPRKRAISALSADATVEEEEGGATPQWDNTFFSSFTAASGRAAAPVPRRRPGLTFAQQMGLFAPTRQGAGVGMGGNRLGHAFGHRPDEMLFAAEPQPSILQAPADLDADSTNPFYVPSSHPTSSPVIRRPLAEVQLPHPHEDPSSPDDEMMPSTPLSKPLNFLGADLSPPRNSAIRDINKALDLSASKRANAEAKDAKRRRKDELRRMMDEDDNPFLQKLGEGSMAPGKHVTVDESKPYVTYVFRGAKKVFANPWLAPGAAPRADHADEEEDEPELNVAPRLLWSKGPTRTAREEAADELDDTDDDESPSTPLQTTVRKGVTRFAELDPTEEFALRGTSRAFSSTHSIGDLDSPEPDPPVRRGLLFGAGSGSGQGISQG